MQKIKVFLVDDHKLIRDGIKAHLEEAQDFEIVGEAADGQEAINKLKETTADVVLMDINMDGMDGISCTQILSQELPELNVLALSMLAENQHIKEMIKAGAKGYLLKTATEQEIKQGIRAVYQGQNFYSAEVTQIVMNNLGTANRKKRSRFDPLAPLTSREKEVLALIIKEYSNQEIADELYISKRTVDAHKRNLLEKTGAKNVAGLVVFALNNQILDNE
ncbi:response regulator transcription factor [Saprospira grandis]|uniref:response regulator transcription factor n=1 Tax=Saprospira grandis TaxID=1008 RepID=UPI0022DE0D5B|nr:response regulator transcription factor [Saprospira grandis]WBM75057.1 response regulator transcription factor [Saprospira grandis]